MSRVRRAIIAHPGLQALAFVALLCLHIWTLEPVAPNAARMLAAVFLMAIPVCSNLLHRDRPSELGLRVDNLRHSSRHVGAATIFCSLVIVAASTSFGFRSTLNAGAGLGAIGYLGWSFSQQYALQAFIHRRLREALGCSRRASLASALLFGVVHLPNPLLVVTVTVAGYIWCRVFERAPNLFTLAVSHAWLATLLMTSVPEKIHHIMRVGPGFWE